MQIISQSNSKSKKKKKTKKHSCSFSFAVIATITDASAGFLALTAGGSRGFFGTWVVAQVQQHQSVTPTPQILSMGLQQQDQPSLVYSDAQILFTRHNSGCQHVSDIPLSP